ncbi:hypothetical protein L3X38_034804 [Prunus dulcis]|uniref:Uncharacterized protein n=1 Tax=Prunus dulcis TaxID=3755 RepID=A0AAD4VII1_PRUDU|nr:hypothetical protein L3X38_034804 [Prunus dulcis]
MASLHSSSHRKLTSLLSSLREILENLYCLSKKGVDVHPKVCADGPAAAYHRRSGLKHAGPLTLQATSAEQVSGGSWWSAPCPGC